MGLNLQQIGLQGKVVDVKYLAKMRQTKVGIMNKPTGIDDIFNDKKIEEPVIIVVKSRKIEVNFPNLKN